MFLLLNLAIHFVSREGQGEQVAVAEAFCGLPMFFVLVVVPTLERDAEAGEGFAIFGLLVFPNRRLDLTAAGDG